MRKGGGKAKGGAYEITISRKIAAAFKKFNIKEADCYRTKNSGATKKEPGDIQFSPALSKIFPAIVECKHAKKIDYKMGAPLHCQYALIKSWWEQVRKEQKQSPKRFALLIMRQNHCNDMVAFMPQTVDTVTNFGLKIRHTHFCPIIIKTAWKSDEVWIVPLADFLHFYTIKVTLCLKSAKK